MTEAQATLGGKPEATASVIQGAAAGVCQTSLGRARFPVIQRCQDLTPPCGARGGCCSKRPLPEPAEELRLSQHVSRDEARENCPKHAVLSAKVLLLAQDGELDAVQRDPYALYSYLVCLSLAYFHLQRTRSAAAYRLWIQSASPKYPMTRFSPQEPCARCSQEKPAVHVCFVSVAMFRPSRWQESIGKACCNGSNRLVSWLVRPTRSWPRACLLEGCQSLEFPCGRFVVASCLGCSWKLPQSMRMHAETPLRSDTSPGHSTDVPRTCFGGGLACFATATFLV